MYGSGKVVTPLVSAAVPVAAAGLVRNKEDHDPPKSARHTHDSQRDAGDTFIHDFAGAEGENSSARHSLNNSINSTLLFSF